eukprot:TRINITY_DN69582_c0_g1_i1.p1 TRINITY_DN69582_c0_g1~~TRINITY_DN69582_c0_g1_i1.p1  ORF type:complete len:332 (+),score=46.11 TRINITY_DN69582_c0_g1_i1:92-1087(+)
MSPPMTRGVSLRDVTALKPLAGSRSQTHDVNCGCCTLSFRPGSPALWGLGTLELRLSSSSRLCSQDRSRLSEMLHRVRDFGVDFVVLYDFGSFQPSMHFIDCLTSCWRESGDLWADRVKGGAVLIKDNLLHAAASESVSRLLETCAFMAQCPFVVCHSKAAAAEFFCAGIRPLKDEAGESAFVSVVGVQESQRSSGALAHLAPLNPDSGPAVHTHTFHHLPDGDVRVIQSAPGDVLRPLPEECGQGQQTNNLRAVKLAYSSETIQKLVGTYFHVGELIIDAELETFIRHGTIGGLHAPLPPPKAAYGCLGNLQSVVYKVIQRLLNSLEGFD